MAELNYENASKELEEILNQLKNDEVSIDELSDKVERASKLILFCKEKLSNTEKKVEDIISKLGL
jgi:exodeoxyribonuclease VII small subunit